MANSNQGPHALQQLEELTNNHPVLTSVPLQINVMLQSPPRRFQCPHCAFAPTRASERLAHIRLIHPDTTYHRCSTCSYIAINAFELMRHIHTKHVQIGAYKCDTCPSHAWSLADLQEHIILHNHKSSIVRPQLVPFACIFCPFQSTIQNQYSRHFRSDHQQRITTDCPMCPYTTATSTQLKTHIIKLHAQADSLKCPFCKIAQATITQLQAHLFWEHPSATGYLCVHCLTTSINYNQAKNHQLRHLVRPAYKCEYCAFSSPRLAAVQAHFRLVHPKRRRTTALIQETTIAAQNEFLNCKHCNYSALSRTQIIHHNYQEHPFAASPDTSQSRIISKNTVSLPTVFFEPIEPLMREPPQSDYMAYLEAHGLVASFDPDYILILNHTIHPNTYHSSLTHLSHQPRSIDFATEAFQLNAAVALGTAPPPEPIFHSSGETSSTRRSQKEKWMQQYSEILRLKGEQPSLTWHQAIQQVIPDQYRPGLSEYLLEDQLTLTETSHQSVIDTPDQQEVTIYQINLPPPVQDGSVSLTWTPLQPALGSVHYLPAILPSLPQVTLSPSNSLTSLSWGISQSLMGTTTTSAAPQVIIDKPQQNMLVENQVVHDTGTTWEIINISQNTGHFDNTFVQGDIFQYQAVQAPDVVTQDQIINMFEGETFHPTTNFFDALTYCQIDNNAVLPDQQWDSQQQMLCEPTDGATTIQCTMCHATVPYNLISEHWQHSHATSAQQGGSSAHEEHRGELA